jgi:prepilin-type N-terminal cleavage/methylation domain-containing protein
MRRQRRGFTLMESLVACALLGVLLAAIILNRWSGQRQAVDLDFRTGALRSAQLLFAHIKADFDSYLPDPPQAGFTRPAPQGSVAFARVRRARRTPDLPLDEGLRPVSDRVIYRFDPGLHAVLRDGVRVETTGKFETVRFLFTGSRPADPDPACGDVLRVEVEVVPPESLGRTGAGTPRARFTMEMTSIQGTLDRACSQWVSGD